MISVSVLVFKQWIYSSNRKRTPLTVSKMMNYIATRDGVALDETSFEEEIEKMQRADGAIAKESMNYIATRDGVAAEEGQSHGLFGKMFGMKEQGCIEDLNLARSHVENIARQKTTVYNAVISFNGSTASEKGYTSRKVFEQLVEENINTISRGMGIPPRRLEYAAAVHMEKDHPHVHLMYWDTEQSICINYIQPQQSNDIRKQLTKTVFKDELSEIMLKKDEAHKELIAQIYKNDDSILKNSVNVFNGISISKVYKMAKAKPYSGLILTRKGLQNQISQTIHDLITISEKLKTEYPSGALKYKYLPLEIKKELDELTKKLIQNNPQIAREYKKYMDTVKKHSEIFGGKKNTQDYSNAAKKKLYAAIGNKSLSVIKDLRKISVIDLMKANHNSYMQSRALWLMQAALNVIGFHHHQENAPTDKNNQKYLSKIQKAVLQKKLREKESPLEWGE